MFCFCVCVSVCVRVCGTGYVKLHCRSFQCIFLFLCFVGERLSEMCFAVAAELMLTDQHASSQGSHRQSSHITECV